MSKIQRWFNLPVGANLEEQFQVRLIRTLLIVALIANVASSALYPVLWGTAGIYYLSTSNALIFLMVFVCFLLLKIEQVKWASAFLSTSIWLILASVSLVSGQIAGPPFIICVALPPLISGFLSGTRYSVLITGLNFVVGLILVWRQPAAGLSIVSDGGGYAYLITYTVAFGIIPVIVYMWHQRSAEMVNQVQAREKAQQEMVIYQIRTERLEEAVVERTQALQEALERETSLAEQLQKSLTVEKEMSHNLSRIMTQVSHEFRTPLTIISTSEELLYKHNHELTEEKKVKHRGRIKESIGYITNLIDEISFLNVTQQEKFAVNRQAYPYAAFCRELIQTLRLPQNVMSRLHFTYSPDLPDSSETILVDTLLLKQVIMNLLDNALKYSAVSEPVEMTMRLKGTELTIEIKDYGVGIPIDEQEQIFDPLYRAKNVEVQRGLGLGLYIAHELTKAMAGRLTVFSAGINQGCTATVYIPTK